MSGKEGVSSGTGSADISAETGGALSLALSAGVIGVNEVSVGATSAVIGVGGTALKAVCDGGAGVALGSIEVKVETLSAISA